MDRETQLKKLAESLIPLIEAEDWFRQALAFLVFLTRTYEYNIVLALLHKSHKGIEVVQE
jgi:hypothetical protein